MTARQLMLTNRVVLALSGLGVLGCAVVVALPHVDAFGSWWPAWGVPVDGRVAEALRGLRSREGWSAAASVGALAGSLLLAIWCVRQLRLGARGQLPLGSRDAVALRRAVERAVTEEALKASEVTGCRTRVIRERRRLRLRMRVTLRRDAAPGAALPGLERLLEQVDRTLSPQSVLADVHFVTGTRGMAFSRRRARRSGSRTGR
ncbi:hypothetical protein ACIOMM_04670 [Streptomyces sp. NPDC087908]|uniref:hypothetical protein n=1 Tax=Streptomyces sp. NPDC087908 TaxID=3365820 RepID=UPI0013A4E059|nr:hypothetical protein EAO70_08600 [Streptomyces sp. adm13(2018)]